MSARLIIVSNRLPVTVRVRDGELQLAASAGGLATGLGDWHDRGEGVWVGWPGDLSGLTDAERAQADRALHERRIVPVELSRREVRQSYEGFANGVIWPLFHYLLDRIPLDSRDWDAYRRVNERFAAAVAAEYRPGDSIWVHDYQLLLLPGMLRQRLPDARIGFFLHIPFPSYEVFRTLPWRTDVLEGLLGADLIGFHTYAYLTYFRRALTHLLGLEPDGDRLAVSGRDVRMRAFPMGIDVARFTDLAGSAAVAEELDALKAGTAGRRIVLGVDRLDYTKGIPRRLLAFERLLERHPELRDRVRLIQVAVPSRVGVEPYQQFRKQLDEMVGRINGAWGTLTAAPIHYLYRSVSPEQLVALYRAADVMLVTALRDGMNLVAKEFIASRTDDDGVLLLSELTGAAAELAEAVTINPYDIEGVAAAMAAALSMPQEARATRMRALRQRVGEWTVHRWAEEFLADLHAQPAVPNPRPARPRPLDASSMLERVRGAPSVTLLLDYDGTLVPLERTPELARPDAGLRALLERLARARYRVHLVSGRDRGTLDAWFGALPIALWAEHGAWYRPAGGTEWQALSPIASGWMESVRPILQRFTAGVPGARIEQKTASAAWHYRMADPDLALVKARDLRLALDEALRGQPLEVLEGHKVIEVRVRGVNKARVVERALREDGAQLAVAIGDDRTDEDMFAALPADHVSIRVGDAPSRAQFSVRDPAAVRDLLNRLATTVPGWQPS